MKNFLLGFLAMTVVLAAGAAMYLQFGLADVRSDESAPRWLRAYSRFATRTAVHRNARSLVPPAAVTDSMLIAGGHTYLNGCAGCHGTPERARTMPPSFRPIPQLPELGTKYSVSEVHWVIDHGIRRSEMSAYGIFYKPENLWALAEFVARMTDLPPAVRDSLKQKAN
jgi:mono/diheme cytochrome c family protein